MTLSLTAVADRIFVSGMLSFATSCALFAQPATMAHWKRNDPQPSSSSIGR